MGVEGAEKLPLVSLNHVSFVCRSVSESVKFYEEVLGFVLVRRPSSFKFEGAWLFNYGIGIHLLESDSPEEVPRKKGPINPKGNHISFQCSNVQLVMRKLRELEVEYVTAVVEEGGVKVNQLFFHDPDGYMIEICNCDELPVLPLSCPLKRPTAQAEESSCLPSNKIYGTESAKARCSKEAEDQMMGRLLQDMTDISFQFMTKR